MLTGFKYEILISYSQKDNQYDGWVTKFVANLKKELEATFKADSWQIIITPDNGFHYSRL